MLSRRPRLPYPESLSERLNDTGLIDDLSLLQKVYKNDFGKDFVKETYKQTITDCIKENIWDMYDVCKITNTRLTNFSYLKLYNKIYKDECASLEVYNSLNLR